MDQNKTTGIEQTLKIKKISTAFNKITIMSINLTIVTMKMLIAQIKIIQVCVYKFIRLLKYALLIF